MRLCLVTPFAWSVPHDVNDHVAGIAGELRKLGHSVTVIAPSSRAADLREGRRALLGDARADMIAVGPAVPISRRSSMGIPVGSRANLTFSLTRGEYDVVHGVDRATLRRLLPPGGGAIATPMSPRACSMVAASNQPWRRRTTPEASTSRTRLGAMHSACQEAL